MPGLLALHATIRGRMRTAAPESVRPMARRGMIVGLSVLGVGVVLLFGYAALGDWAMYQLATPLLICAGAGLVAYTWRVFEVLRDPAQHKQDDALLARRAAIVLVYVLIAAGIFWATATVAQWSGRGVAQEQAGNLDRLPRVILDTKERLYLRDPIVQETVLPVSDGQTFHYRYRRLRLLIASRDRMFLVPEKWTASDSTLVVPMDGSVRVQFQFQNQPP